MSALMNLFLFGYGFLCLAAAGAIDYDISNRDCVNPSLRWCIRLLFIFSSMMIASSFMLLRFDSWCFDKCATFEGKEVLKKYEGGPGTLILFLINVFILVTMSISFSVLNNDPNCEISDTTRYIIISVIVISSLFCLYGIYRASASIKKSRKEEAQKEFSKGLIK